jgi:uncharacterized membrane protein YidH (DUF202 family)
MIGLGVVIAKLRYILGLNLPESTGIFHAANIGLLFAIVGMLTIAASVFFFLEIRAEIRTRTYSAKIHFVIALAAVMVILGSVVVWYLMQPSGS